jgi:hypothetical protein
MTTSPELEKRPSLALWGTAHLAWGVALFVGLVYVAQHLPLSASPHLERLSMATYLVGLGYLALVGWRHVDRGWQLRRPEIHATRPWLLEPAAHLLVALSALTVFFREASSRLLATGLDRLAIALIVASAGSLVLWFGLALANLRDHSADSSPTVDPPTPLRHLGLLLAAILLSGLVNWLELSRW